MLESFCCILYSYHSYCMTSNYSICIFRGFCQASCRLECRRKISLQRLHEIYEAFWGNESYDARRAWVFSMTSRKVQPNRRTVYTYHLPTPDGERIKVCRTMFNKAIGYSIRNVMVKHMMSITEPGALFPPKDSRKKAKNPGWEGP